MKKAWVAVMRMRTIVSAFVLGTALIAGCSGGSSGGGTTPVAAPTGTVSGQVASAVNNAPVAGATVSTAAGTTTSALDGSFTVVAGTGDRTVVHVEAAGFAEAFPVARVTAGQTTNLGVRLLPTGVVEQMIVATGGTVSNQNLTAQVIIPANGLVPENGGAASGTVNVAITPINPAVDTKLMPGDFNGVSAGGGSPVPIESFGAMLIDIRDAAGTRYNLAPGTTSTIRIPLGTLSPTLPATIPLWFFDEATGLWKEEGTATLQGAAPNQYYEGTVTHFSYWNADQGWTPVFVTGCVHDSNGQPVAFLDVQANGLDFSGTDGDFTRADGTFRVAIPLNSRATLSVSEYVPPSFVLTPVTNVLTIGPSPVDFTLPNCLVKQPGPLTITTSVLSGGNVGGVYNQTLAATGGIPGYVWSLNPASNPLPAGLTLNPTGVISGIPTTVGSTTITVKVTDSVAGTVTKDLNITINPPGVLPVTIITTALSGGTVGSPYSTTVTASGGTGALTWSVVSGALPSGLSLNPSTGMISGTPTTQGVSNFTIQAQDSGNPPQSNQKQFTVTINPVSGGGGGGGTLTISGAPANVGGTFVADPSLTQVIPPIQFNIAAVAWGETVSASATHIEALAIGFDVTNNLPQASAIVFTLFDGTAATGWACGDLSNACGVTVNRSTGTVTFNGSVLTDVNFVASPITLNGTLNFTPF